MQSYDLYHCIQKYSDAILHDWWIDRLLPITVALHLVGFIVKPYLADQLLMKSKSLTLLIACMMSLTLDWMYTCKSLAYRRYKHWKCWVTRLMNIENNKGDNIPPWGMLVRKSHQLNDRSSMWIRCCRPWTFRSRASVQT